MTPIWIPGWQYDAQAFQPLFTQLNLAQPTVLEYHDSSLSRQHWLAAQAASLPQDSVLIGWSLGGMLACELAHLNDNVEKVLVLNANMQFAGQHGLATAMADNFMQRYQRNAELTRKRFATLIDAQPSEWISTALLDGDRQHSLQWLYDIDLQTQPLSCPVSVLLAEDDQLVPADGAELAWQTAGALVQRMPGQHSLPLLHPDSVAQWLLQQGVTHG